MQDPLVRARHLKSVLAGVDRQPRRQALRDRIGPALTASIEEAAGTDWLPIEHDVALARALEAVLGEAGLADFNREMLRQSLSGPLLRALVDLSSYFLKPDPGSWASWVPRAWMLMFKGFGRWTVVRQGEGVVTLTLDRLPPVCATDAVWPRSVASTLSGILPAVGAVGTVELELVDPEAGTLIFSMRWQAAAAAASA